MKQYIVTAKTVGEIARETNKQGDRAFPHIIVDNEHYAVIGREHKTYGLKLVGDCCGGWTFSIDTNVHFFQDQDMVELISLDYRIGRSW